MTTDIINRPPHYTRFKIQPIEVIEDWDLPAHLANVVKYIARRDFKEDALQDLEKAAWYLGRYINLIRDRSSRIAPAELHSCPAASPGHSLDHSDR